MTLKTVTIATISAVALAGCASKSSEIAAMPTSSAQYSNLSCAQLSREAWRIEDAVKQLSAAQDDAADNDAAMTAVSLILFWPAAFMIDGDGGNAQALAQAKGQQEAVRMARLEKGC